MGLGIIERMALGTVRGILNYHIGKFTPPQLQEAIDENRNLWGATPDKMQKQIINLKNRFRNIFDKFQEEITTELLVEWLRLDQPRLNTIIMKEARNYRWFDAQVKTFLEQIRRM